MGRPEKVTTYVSRNIKKKDVWKVKAASKLE